MARLLTYDCSCGYQTAERVEYNPPAGTCQVAAARYVIDVNVRADHDGYPTKDIDCPKCGLPVHSKKWAINNVPDVYFNYIGEDFD